MEFLKRHLSMLIAIGFATLSSIAIYHYLQTRESVSVATPIIAPAAVAETIPVVVTKMELPIGHKLTEADLEVQQWPKKIVTDQQFQEIPQLIGKMLRANILAQEPLTGAKLLDENENFTDMIPENQNAVTISIPKNHYLMKYLEKGMSVDILATYDSEQGTQTAKIITRAAHVLSVDSQTMEREGERGIANVMVLVPSRFVSQIVYAMNHGELELVLSGQYKPILEVTSV